MSLPEQILTSPDDLRTPPPVQLARVGSAAPVVTSKAKRSLDFLGAALGLLVLSPVLLLVALAIRLDSRGPVFFRQERAGLFGDPFMMFKFRTMHTGTSDDKHREYVQGLVSGARESRNGNGVYKLVSDDRVTQVGRFLRRTSLDELPQLINVLRGEMSLVGPRPAISYEVQLYEEWQHERLGCRPGITGLWQVSGRNMLTYRQMCELDMRYIREWSFVGDLVILAKTIPVVVTNSGGAH